MKALDQVSFNLDRGRILGIVGPNGSGKTTLLKIIATLLIPDAGEVSVAGFNTKTHDLCVKKLLGMVSSDDRALYNRLTGQENLECFAALHGLSAGRARSRIRELLKLFNVTYERRRLDTCSTGMRRTIALVQALLHEPELILADEITRSLDMETATIVRGHLRALAQQGKTVMCVTHDIGEAAEIGDEFLFLDRGRVSAAGTLAQLRTVTGRPDAGLREIYRSLIRHDA